MRFPVPLAMATILSACEASTAPPDGRAFTAPPIYQVWWSRVEQCSGFSGDLASVHWYLVPPTPGIAGFYCGGAICLGRWNRPHTIWLVGPNASYSKGVAGIERVVEHEMLHDLIQSAGHPSEVFARCGLSRGGFLVQP